MTGSLKIFPLLFQPYNLPMMNLLLPDTRPYPTDPVKNELLLYASQIAHQSTGRSLATEQLRSKINEMLAQNFYLGLSVAMSMAADAPTYTALMDALADVLNAKNETEIQWFALPVVVVAGSKQAKQLHTSAPTAELAACLANYPHTRPLSRAQWLPQLIRAQDFAEITADQWYAAKQNLQAAEQFAASLPTAALPIPADQSVHVLYALGYGEPNVQNALGQNLREAALPLMQVWQENLATQGVTLFTNPLAPNAPIAALADANHTRLRMALDVFAANAIRAIRLQSPRVGVVMAAQAGGRLLFGFSAAEAAYGLQPQVFTWTLSPRENIGVVQQNFLDLMVDCQVEQIYQLNEALDDGAELPSFAEAQKLSGFNPLFQAA